MPSRMIGVMSGRSSDKTSAIRRVRHIPVLAPRRKDAHKGDFGRVLVIGGSVGMSGAPALAGLAALRAGAGLVTIGAPRSVQPIVAMLCPCATTLALPETSAGQLDPAAARLELARRGLLSPGTAPDVVVIGMGLGRGRESDATTLWQLIDEFRIGARVPMVIDADALNRARRVDGKPAVRVAKKTPPEVWNTRTHPRTVITPHPGELARMLGRSTADIQSDR